MSIGIVASLLRMSWMRSWSGRLGDGGCVEVTALIADRPSSPMVTEPLVIESRSQIARMRKRDPDMPASSLRYELCDCGGPGTVFRLTIC